MTASKRYGADRSMKEAAGLSPFATEVVYNLSYSVPRSPREVAQRIRPSGKRLHPYTGAVATSIRTLIGLGLVKAGTSEQGPRYVLTMRGTRQRNHIIREAVKELDREAASMPEDPEEV